jgi:hypothetical protein
MEKKRAAKWTGEDMLAFAQWWRGPLPNEAFQGKPGLEIKDGYKYWAENVYIPSPPVITKAKRK